MRFGVERLAALLLLFPGTAAAEARFGVRVGISIGILGPGCYRLYYYPGYYRDLELSFQPRHQKNSAQREPVED
jgi:hypothetical protein